MSVRTLPIGIAGSPRGRRRHHCFDHVTRGHTGETGSIRAPLQTRPVPLVPCAVLCANSFRVLPIPHGPTLESKPPRNNRLRLIETVRGLGAKRHPLSVKSAIVSWRAATTLLQFRENHCAAGVICKRNDQLASLPDDKTGYSAASRLSKRSEGDVHGSMAMQRKGLPLPVGKP